MLSHHQESPRRSSNATDTKKKQPSKTLFKTPVTEPAETPFQAATVLKPCRDSLLGRQIHLSNLPPGVDWREVKDLMRAAGNVVRANVVPDKAGVDSHAVALFHTAPDAIKALDMFHGYEWKGYRLLAAEDLELNSVLMGHVDDAAQDSQEPRHDEVTSRRQVIITNLPNVAGWQDLKDLFRSCGTVLRADIKMEPYLKSSLNAKSKGIGTITFTTRREAERALEMFDKFDWFGKVIQVRLYEEDYIDKTLSVKPSSSKPIPMIKKQASPPKQSLSFGESKLLFGSSSLKSQSSDALYGFARMPPGFSRHVGTPPSSYASLLRKSLLSAPNDFNDDMPTVPVDTESVVPEYLNKPPIIQMSSSPVDIFGFGADILPSRSSLSLASPSRSRSSLPRYIPSAIGPPPGLSGTSNRSRNQSLSTSIHGTSVISASAPSSLFLGSSAPTSRSSWYDHLNSFSDGRQ